MTEPALMNFVEQAREASGCGESQQAYDLLIKADASNALTGPDLALLADVAYSAGHLDATIDAWERAHAQAIRAGDHLAAAGAAVRVAMHLLFDTALMAPVRAWINRAERLLVLHHDTPVHAWLAVVRNYERLLSGDFETARQWARQAIDIGTKCDPAAAAIGRVAEARSIILGGDVTRGLKLLNDAAVATVSGELDPFLTGMVYCELVCAFQALAQYELAEEWTAAMERSCRGHAVGSIHGRCRVHRAEILRLRGSCVAAENEVLLACEELRPYLHRELGWPLTELGRIRLRKGDIVGAQEAFQSAHELGWDSQPGPALVLLAKGDVALAAKSIRDALENPLYVPSKELPPHTELRRAPLLEAQVEIEVAAGNLHLARAAAEDFSRIAALFESKALIAGAALAHGRVSLADGDTVTARRHFEEARHLWSEIGAPYEMALAGMGLANAYRAEANEERAIVEFEASRTTFERIGAVDRATEAARASAPRRETPSASAPVLSEENVFCREGDYWSLSFAGHTVRVRDLKGMQYLARLLADPGRDFHVLDLLGDRRSGSSDMDAGPLLDAQAKSAYRRRLTEIEEDIEEARTMRNPERASQAEAERDFLLRELSRAVGLGGRDRLAGSASERARASVTRAVRHAMTRIREYHPALAAHLEHATRTGTYCAYVPDPRIPVGWKL